MQLITVLALLMALMGLLAVPGSSSDPSDALHDFLPDLPCLLQPGSGTVRAAAAGLFILKMESWHVLINSPGKNTHMLTRFTDGWV